MSAVDFTFPEDIFKEMGEFIEDQDKLFEGSLNETRAFQNLLDQRSITDNSSGENFISAFNAESERIKYYAKISTDLETFKINLAQSRATLIQATTSGIHKGVVRLAAEFDN